jgi:hypothetical protein
MIRFRPGLILLLGLGLLPAAAQAPAASPGLTLPPWFWKMPSKPGCVYAVGISERACDRPAQVALADARALAAAWLAQGATVAYESMFLDPNRAAVGDLEEETHTAWQMRARPVQAHPSPARILERVEVGPHLVLTLAEMDLRVASPAGPAGGADQCLLTLGVTQTRIFQPAKLPRLVGMRRSHLYRWETALARGGFGAPFRFSVVQEHLDSLREGSATVKTDRLTWNQDGQRGSFHGSLNQGGADDPAFQCPDDGPPLRLAAAPSPREPAWMEDRAAGTMGAVGSAAIPGEGLGSGLATAYYRALAQGLGELAGKLRNRVTSMLATLGQPGSPANTSVQFEQTLTGATVREAWIDPANQHLYLYMTLDPNSLAAGQQPLKPSK